MSRLWIICALLTAVPVQAAQVWTVTTPLPVEQDTAQHYALADFRLRTWPEVRVDIRLIAMLSTGECARDTRGECQTLGVAYTGAQAVDFVNYVNTGNFTVNSLHKQVMQQLRQQGVLPPGNLSGNPGIATLTPTVTPTDTPAVTATPTGG